ncbi:cytochrome b [Herbaspirillum sp.]|uniref:cytochrome b n=1 Tax=Herbaspirillum sp. TaxID=1890675 RepID=UPI001B107121|nr:cytochrome b [Herbaspirillum sp.]MBO9537005.1 cytochrome b [Herbaspirillum sp.]
MTREKYHPLSVAAHWLIFGLFVVALAAIEVRGDLPKGHPWKDILRTIHMHAGQLVLWAAVLRLIFRGIWGAPAEVDGAPWQQWAARGVHWALYIVMFALPVTGILFTQAGGKEVMFFGMQLPALVSPDQAMRDQLKELHELIGNAVYFLVGAHVLGALWHQFVDRVPVLQRMAFHSRKK